VLARESFLLLLLLNVAAMLLLLLLLLLLLTSACFAKQQRWRIRIASATDRFNTR
jgi:hypothetical protein